MSKCIICHKNEAIIVCDDCYKAELEDQIREDEQDNEMEKIAMLNEDDDK